MQHFQAVLFGAVSTILIVLTLPLLLELLLVTCAFLLPARRLPGREQPRYPAIKKLMILVPSHNEGLGIGACVKALRVSTAAAVDILVIAHNCDDETAEHASSAGAIVSVLNDSAKRGKGEALSHGFDLAFGHYGADAVLIVDADTTISPDVTQLVTHNLAYAQVVQCRDESRGAGTSLRDHLYALAFIGMNVVRPLGRQRLGLSCGIFGNGFALRKEVLQKVSYNAHSIIEDLEFHLALNAAGICTHFVGDALVRADPPVDVAGMHSQSARWEGGRVRMFLAKGPQVFQQILSGRFALIEPLIDLMSIPLAFGLTLLLLLLVLPTRYAHLYSVVGLIIVTIHVFMAVWNSPDRSGDALALLYAPLYLLGKLAMVPAVLRMARGGAAWIRTSRVSGEKQGFRQAMLAAFKRVTMRAPR